MLSFLVLILRTALRCCAKIAALLGCEGMPALKFLLAKALSRVFTAAGGCGGLAEAAAAAAAVVEVDDLISLLLLRQRPIILLEDCF